MATELLSLDLQIDDNLEHYELLNGRMVESEEYRIHISVI